MMTNPPITIVGLDEKEAAVERLAGIFYDRMELLDPTFEGEATDTWDKLPEANRAFWIACMETVLASGEKDIRTALGLP